MSRKSAQARSFARRDGYGAFSGLAVACVLVVTLLLGSLRIAAEPGDILSAGYWLTSLEKIRAHELAPLITVPLFVAGSLVLAPIYGMIAVCALLFDPLTACMAALGGTMIATATTHWMGTHLGSAFGRRLPARISARIQAMARSACIWSIAGLQCLPIGPFAVVNMLVGALGVPFRTFIAGTFVAMVPTVVFICIAVGRARAVLDGGTLIEPWALAALAASGTALLVLGAWRRQCALRSEPRE